MNRAFLAIPTYAGQVGDYIVGAALRASKEGRLAACNTMSSSFSSLNYNSIWATALNLRSKGFTHLAQLHADIEPEDWWLDRLFELMEEHRADVMSAVIPIKDKRGLTSAGLETDDAWRIRRLTMHEINEMDETWTHPQILVNTGLMLVDMRKDWVEHVHFGFMDAIVKVNGAFVPRGVSEDWVWSRMARERGARLFNTRAVKATHYGANRYPNFGTWGTLKTDDYGA